jgi:hypothetical protein
MRYRYSNTLIYRGMEFVLHNMSLYHSIDDLSDTERPRLNVGSITDLQRFQATWEIEGGKLYLTNLAESKCDRGADWSWHRDPATIFSDSGDPVFASWVCGKWRCIEGKRIWYNYKQPGLMRERERFFYFQRGLLMRETLLVNGPQPVWYEVKPEGTRLCLTAETGGDVIEDPFPNDALPSQAPLLERRATKKS